MKKIAILLLSLGLLFLSASSNDENRETINKQFEDPKIDKILVIGNSFSNDALTYFYDIVSDNEIEPNLILGHIDIGGSSLETHRINALTDYKDFSYQKTTSSDKETLDRKSVV